MTVTLTYDNTLSRVRISATGLAAANVALVERSTDLVRWTTVRGGSAYPVIAGAFAVPLDDYEFPTSGSVTYRVSGVETGAITYVGAGAGVSGNNTSLTPPLPAGLIAGDLLVTLASIRNSGTGTVVPPTGWSVIATSGNVSLLGRRYVTGDVAQLVTFAGGAVDADTMARTAAFRRAGLPPVVVANQLNPSAQNIGYPALTIAQDGCVVLIAGWKQDDWTSVASAGGGFTEIAETVSTAGLDAGQVWDYLIQTTAADIPFGQLVVTIGSSAISRGLVVALGHAANLNQQTASITPTLDGVWLKSIARPFLNRRVDVVLPASVTSTKPSRAGIFDILGRSLPVAVNTVRASRRWLMLVRTETAADTLDTDLMLASGDVLLIQAPPGCMVRTGYVSVGDVTDDAHPLRPLRVTFQLPLTEVAAPGPGVVGATSTWATVLAAYGSWQDVLAANATWADLLELVGDPSEVIVP